ncbi:ATP-binding protein [Streptomyces marispadix]|uniref:Tetratricopeptide repeat protein n=1 Tax=Streptomyces marispadix TaxID=2922868 RepID=A0ABS9SX13_9ACTN|nr:tetratricopeptide repeat protein [Streptomyces marispadix]MCH6160816.1 tetratricopeptide repeat protein [Streptomyces marispadix]
MSELPQGPLDGMAGAAEFHNTVSGTVQGPVVQAGQFHGDVHLHAAHSAPKVPRQLPAAPGTFIGRDAELASLSDVLEASVQEGSAMVISAIGGTGGIGKTWLALHWAHQHVSQFPDGQLFIDLRGFDPSDKPVPPHEAVRGFLDALVADQKEIPADLSSQLALYRSLVAQRRILVVLDNARDSDQVAPLLPGSPTCTVLVTSRDQMASLSATHSAHMLPVDTLSEPDARKLLSHHLGQERQTAEPTAVTDLVAWCAGLPLALSIVASHARLEPLTPLADIAAELREASTRLQVLDAGTSVTQIEAVLSWSYEALTAEQAAAFRLVGLAPGSDLSVHAAASLTGQSVTGVRRVLRQLVRVSLVQQHAVGRYRMHDLVRLYAAKRARAEHPQEERDRALQGLAEFCARTAHDADVLIAPHHTAIELGEHSDGCQPQHLADAQAAWEWFSAERANLMAVLHMAAERGWHARVWQLAWTLTTFQLRQGHLHDNLIAWQAGASASKHLNDPHTRTRSHRHLGRACAQLGRHQEALTHLEEGLAGAEGDGDQLGQAHTHRAIAKAWEEQGNYQKALEHAQQALQIYDSLSIEVSGSHALNEVGWYTAKLGHFAQARQYCARALTKCRRSDDRSGEARTLLSLGYIDHHTGDTHTAERHFRRAIALYSNLGDTTAQADALDHLGHALADHDTEEADRAWRQALELYSTQHRDADAQRIHACLKKLPTPS